jgi:hypothetical protein
VLSCRELVKADFPVSDQNDKKELVELRELNDELTDSLRRCRKILHDCRERLAANSNGEAEGDEDWGRLQSV